MKPKERLDHVARFRTTKDLWDDFALMCEEEGKPPSDVLRNLFTNYVSKRKQIAKKEVGVRSCDEFPNG